MPAFRGAIFDVDGVLVDSPHEKAWRESLRQLMESDWRDIRDRTSWSPEAFTSRVYEEQMSGQPASHERRARRWRTSTSPMTTAGVWPSTPTESKRWWSG